MRYVYYSIQFTLISMFSLILIDMFILGGKLKDIFVRANTSDYSFFSTDGQSNYVLLFNIFIVVMLLWLGYKLVFSESIPKAPKNNKIEEKIKDKLEEKK